MYCEIDFLSKSNRLSGLYVSEKQSKTISTI